MKRHFAIPAAVAAFGLLALAPLSQAQSGQSTAGQKSGSQSTQSGSANRLAGADQTFAMKAAQGGMAEVKLGQLAKDHASSSAVKQFGQQMVDDHSKANDELKDLASKKGITLPANLAAKDQATYDRLSKLNGAEFDRAYMADMVKDHRTDVSEFRRESERGQDSDLKSWAGKTLPTLEHHLQMAESTDKEVRGGSASGNSNSNSKK